MRFGSLFSGIGGLDLGLERAGMECAWQVEKDEWCRKVLAKHWPDVPKYGDIKDVNGEELEPVELICGGFPCQPVSYAGRRRAQEDDRWLWPEFHRLIRVLRPRYVLLENVPGLLTAGFGEVVGGLAESGYDAEWDCIPAASVGAPHLRYRVFVVAYANEQGLEGAQPAQRRDLFAGSSGGDGIGNTLLANTNGTTRRPAWSAGEALFGPEALERLRRRSSSDGHHWAVEPDVGRVANGIPHRVDRLRGLGNAVVPQVAEWVGRQIVEAATFETAGPVGR